MPIITGDYVTRLSGGASNSDANASLGGAKSSTVASASVDALFDGVTPAEATAGRVEYRCIYLHNANATDTMLSVVAWISANTPSTSTTLAIGVGSSAINGTEQTVANETTAPTSVTFSEPANQAAAISLGSPIPPGQHRAIWLRRTVTAGAGPIANDSFTLSFYSEFTS